MRFLPLSSLLTGSFITGIQEPFVAPQPKVALTPEIDHFIEGTLKNWNSPAGVAIAVVQKDTHGGWSVETKGYGTAKTDGSNVTEDTLFAIGSNSKLFDVIAAGLLISNESLSPRISWSTKISSIIPEWELADPIASSQSEIIDLMSHRTGLPRHDIFYHDEDMPLNLISKLKYLRPSAEFREIPQYNNFMYTVLSYIPEVLLKVPFTRYVKEHIFVPLGLKSTTYSAHEAQENGNLACGFGREHVNRTEDIFSRGIPRAMPYWSRDAGENGSISSGFGGVISSAKDIATWLQVLLMLGQNPSTNEQIIPSSIILKAAAGFAPFVYGGGQIASSYRGHCFKTMITRFPFDNVGVAVLSNDDAFGGPFSQVIKYRIVDEIFDIEPIDWNSRIKQAATSRHKQQMLRLIPRPTDPSPPSVSFTYLTGEYRHPAYGPLYLCALPSAGSFPVSPGCKQLIDELPIRLPRTVNISVPTFFTRIENTWASYLRFQHFDGNLFNVSGFDSLQILNPSENSMQMEGQKYWAYSDDETRDNPITAEFAFDTDDRRVIGFGITGNFWGAGAGVKDPVGESIQERAEVWFNCTY
ncbi:hypothetical protein GYMLUDRAFT_99753 [Collybiopsis luxurians FD-317 M1]|uniref:Beta-lactamase-related domain-containing protein n=1 Tax=Collybiopsis luxurians FD-317 M1 TaxID=944289 RepID=A0A0D0BYQ6_9AGAR|nr:hypothetical protein GYMLUDRAFT_99753 [Collybiopsis luxurians FD-317 M1]